MRSGRLRQLSGLDQTLTAQPGHLLVGALRIPEDHASPVRVITRRMVIALAVLFAAAAVVYLDLSGYRDLRGGPLTFLDCLYFAAVSLSTTGYGDITPYNRSCTFGQHRGVHAAADRVPGRISRHDAQGAVRKVPAGMEDSALEEQSA